METDVHVRDSKDGAGPNAINPNWIFDNGLLLFLFAYLLIHYPSPRADIFRNRPSNPFAFMCVLPILCPFPSLDDAIH